MRTLFNRTVGVLLILASVIGLVFSVGGIVAIWRVKPAASQALVNTLDLLDNTLVTTSQGFVVTLTSLQSAVGSISALQSALETTSKTIGTTQPLLDAVSVLLNEELPQTIRATETAFATAKQSAQVIDTTLTALSFIPLIGVPYHPDVLLGDAIGDISLSISDLPDKLASVDDSLQNTGDSLEVVQKDLSVVAVTIGEIEKSVAQYDQVIKGFQTSVTTIQAEISRLKKQVPNMVNILAWALTIFLTWMAIAQLGLMTQGWELLHRPTHKKEEKEEKAPEKAEAEQVK